MSSCIHGNEFFTILSHSIDLKIKLTEKIISTLTNCEDNLLLQYLYQSVPQQQKNIIKHPVLKYIVFYLHTCEVCFKLVFLLFLGL